MTKKIVKKVKVPGGRVVLHYKKSKPKPAKCGGCGNILHGVPRLRAVQLRKLAKTEKRPERPYGGVFCCRCVRKMFSEKARKV
ncbi:MAG: 50S ribosomal protein L34e [Candidatus Aenigmarchaeota archaeon]|nr:50S ribosomal protein L34e [Candidatus Aenigmarchaeota archaeon]